MDITATTARFFLAAVIVLLTCKGVALLARRVGQPPVVGEMIAGVLLGPSLLGLVFPDAQGWLFPAQVKPMLYVVSHIGLVAFMFGVGHEFAGRKVRGLGKSASMISASGITAPLVLGVALIVMVDGHVDAFKQGVPLWVSAAFVGVTLAITAFPMLARIISERNLTGTRFGSLAMACGALDDGMAWILLAVTIGLATDNPSKILVTAGGTALFVAVLFLGIRPALARLMARPKASTEQLVLVTAIALFAAAWFTDTIGLYSVFGGFLVGFVFPQTPAGERVVAAISPVTRTVFLPLFFAYSGLNTQFGLLTSAPVLLLALGCITVAIVGKFAACWIGGRLAGEENHVAIRVGVLMNARGLMQLIAINVGLQAGIVTPALFSVLVLVAIVTTVMTSPWLSWLDRRAARRAAVDELPVPTPETA